LSELTFEQLEWFDQAADLDQFCGQQNVIEAKLFDFEVISSCVAQFKKEVFAVVLFA
jgi:hypothetical protein